MTEPVIKWAGGKRRLVDQLLPLVLHRRSPSGRYHEPFVGGAAMALALPAGVPVTVSDVCAPLVEAYRAIAVDPRLVHHRLVRLVERHTEAEYYRVRDVIPATSASRAARFIYLNKAGFNGLYRVNRAGVFNVPCGKRRGSKNAPPGCPAEEHLVEFGDRALLWTIAQGDFEQSIERAVEGDVVYADPPYDGTFTYGTEFGEPEQRRLSDALRRAARRGVGVVTTNADTPLVRRLYRWADVRPLVEGRSVAADGERRGDAECVVAVRP